MRVLLTAGMTLLLLASCSQTQVNSNDTAIVGTATTKDGKPVPSDAVITVRLYDYTIADAPVDYLAQQTLQGPGTPSFTFKLAYEQARIDQQRLYAVEVAVRSGGQLIYSNDVTTSVLTQGFGSQINIALAPAVHWP